MGRTPSDTFGLALANAVEISIAILLARRIVPSPDQIKEPRLLFRLIGIAVLAAGASGLITAATIARYAQGIFRRLPDSGGWPT